MLHLVSLENFLSSEKKESQQLMHICEQLRKTFAKVFASHYSTLILKALETNNQERLSGFADLEKKYFDGDFNKHSPEYIQSALHKLYAGGGFDDEVAFIMGFAGLNMSRINANEWDKKPHAHLSKDQIDEIVGYLHVLEKDNRELKEVNFVALVDAKMNVHGFCIYHIILQNEKTILHIRQAAVLMQNAGTASLFARYLTDLYPKAIYEANQRMGNHVPMKDYLIKQGFLTEKKPVLGYSPYYKGLQGIAQMQKLLFNYLFHKDFPPSRQNVTMQPQQSALGLKKTGKYWEAESIPHLFHSAYTFFKKANLDDCYIDTTNKYSHQISKI